MKYTWTDNARPERVPCRRLILLMGLQASYLTSVPDHTMYAFRKHMRVYRDVHVCYRNLTRCRGTRLHARGTAWACICVHRDTRVCDVIHVFGGLDYARIRTPLRICMSLCTYSFKQLIEGSSHFKVGACLRESGEST